MNVTNPVRIERTLTGVTITTEHPATGPRDERSTVITETTVACTQEAWDAAVVSMRPRSAAPTTRGLLIELARQVLTLTGAMSPSQLDDWYETNVGYRPTADDEELITQPVRHRAGVAEMMFRHAAPDGGSNEADDVASMLRLAILNPPTSGDVFEDQLLADARRRGWIL